MPVSSPEDLARDAIFVLPLTLMFQMPYVGYFWTGYAAGVAYMSWDVGVALFLLGMIMGPLVGYILLALVIASIMILYEERGTKTIT